MTNGDDRAIAVLLAILVRNFDLDGLTIVSFYKLGGIGKTANYNAVKDGLNH